MGAGAKWFSGLSPQGPRPAASMAGPRPWNTIVDRARVVPNPDPGRAAYGAWKERVGGSCSF